MQGRGGGGGGLVKERKNSSSFFFFLARLLRSCARRKKKRKTSAYRIMLRPLFSVILWHGMAKCVKQIAVFVATKENGLHLPKT